MSDIETKLRKLEDQMSRLLAHLDCDDGPLVAFIRTAAALALEAAYTAVKQAKEEYPMPISLGHRAETERIRWALDDAAEAVADLAAELRGGKP